MFKLKTQNSKLKTSSGFSLVEMIVVAEIFLVIATVTLLRQSKFSSDILITNVAYETALSIREAQVYGIGSKTGATERAGYGVRFDVNSNTDFNILKYTFEDIGNIINWNLGDPTPGGSPEVFQLLQLKNGEKIRRFCVENPAIKCSDAISEPIDHIDIIFLKPNPDAFIYVNDIQDDTYSDAVIVIESSLGDKCRIVRASASGQISVDPVTADACDYNQI